MKHFIFQPIHGSNIVLSLKKKRNTTRQKTKSDKDKKGQTKKYAPTYINAFQPKLDKYPYGEFPDTMKCYQYMIKNYITVKLCSFRSDNTRLE